MSTVLEEHIRVVYVVVYVNDICIFTKTDDLQDHLEKFEKVLDFLRHHDLLVKGIKCSLFRTEMEFLGFLVSAFLFTVSEEREREGEREIETVTQTRRHTWGGREHVRARERGVGRWE
jgi:hypothetical protein